MPRGMAPFNQIAVVFERAGLIIDACVSPPLASGGGFSFFLVVGLSRPAEARSVLNRTSRGENAVPALRWHSIWPFRLASVGKGWNRNESKTW